MNTQHYFPKAGFGTAFGLPIDEAMQRILTLAKELNIAAEKTPEGQGFGQRLTNAVQARLTSTTRPRIGVLANAAVAPKAEDESFAERLKKACEKRSGKEQREKHAERERSRYKQRRKPTKGE